jgi:two-component system alkaline phosphatase synthesis response regulator PhoP
MNKRILLVDDDRDLVETLTESLETEGYEVIAAYDGNQGLEMIKKGKPDLIVLDVMMPNKHGYQLAKELEGSEFANIPLIMLTAVAEHIRETRFSHQEAMECQADDFISKPVNVDVLLKGIRRLLKK